MFKIIPKTENRRHKKVTAVFNFREMLSDFTYRTYKQVSAVLRQYPSQRAHRLQKRGLNCG